MKELLWFVVGGVVATCMWKCKDRADRSDAALKAFEAAKGAI